MTSKQLLKAVFTHSIPDRPGDSIEIERTLERKAEIESIEGWQAEGKKDGLAGRKAAEPNNLFYYSSWAEAHREYRIAEQEKEFNRDWEGFPF